MKNSPERPAALLLRWGIGTKGNWEKFIHPTDMPTKMSGDRTSLQKPGDSKRTTHLLISKRLALEIRMAFANRISLMLL
ncbi:MAG TPA: hypothetical protein DDX19_04860 [Rhodopirellula baltica]|nr:hypothetical protein [Rhodopirellula baltica]